MKILIVDCILPIEDQLRRIADDTGITIDSLFAAWNERKIAQSATERDFIFDTIREPDKIDTQVIEKRLSYQAQQRQLPKFLFKRNK